MCVRAMLVYSSDFDWRERHMLFLKVNMDSQGNMLFPGERIEFRSFISPEEAYNPDTFYILLSKRMERIVTRRRDIRGVVSISSDVTVFPCRLVAEEEFWGAFVRLFACYTSDMSSVLEGYKQEFLEYLEIERGRAVKTVENYDRYLARFFEQSKAKGPKDITEAKVREFRLWLNRQSTIHGDTLKRRTQNYYLIALRAFLKFLRKRGVTSLSPELIELAKVPQRDLDLITRTELNRLLAAPMAAYKGAENDDDKLRALRDDAMLQLLFSTGLRVSELVALNSDIDLSKDEMSVRGKGDKVRVVFFSSEAKNAVQAYLDVRKDLDEALFVNMGRNATEHTDLRLTSRSVERTVKQYAARAGITKKVTPHIIRHSFATDLLQNGADIRSVQALLGHANIATTQVYTHVTDKHLRDIHHKFHNKKAK